MSESKPMIDLGWANSWSETPKIVEKCRELKHGEQGITTGYSDHYRCVSETYCPVCGYRYKVDSGD